jgi:AbrB family looped-hinge helix DNA binding protein
MFVTKLTSKCQTTIPAKVRKALNLKAGDLVGFEIDGGKVMLRPVKPLDRAYLKALESTLNEWQSPEDEEAYRDL